MKDEKYTILIFVDKEANARVLFERDIFQWLLYTNSRDGHMRGYEWINTARTYNAFTTTFKNPDGIKIVYKWHKNGFTIEQIKEYADVIITDNFTTMQDLKRWLADYGIDRLVLVE